MKILVIIIFALCTAPPFAFYICYAALTGKHVPPGFIKAYAILLVTVLGVALASCEGIEWPGTIGIPFRGLASWLR
jgi:hypothetical protein